MKQSLHLTLLFLLISFISEAQIAPALQWVESVGSPNVASYGNGLQIDAADNLYVNLNLNGAADLNPGSSITTVPAGWYDAVYDNTGNYKSYKKDTVLVENYIYKNGYIYFIGYFDSTYDFDPGAGIKKINSPYTDFCIAKYSSNNTLLWVDDFAGSDVNTQLEGGLFVDNEGNCFVRGFIYGNTVDMDPSSNVKLLQGDANGNQNYIASEFDSNGKYKWAFKLDVSNDDYFPLLMHGSGNHVYFTGIMTGSADLDPGPATHTVSAVSTSETSFLAAYDTSGNYLWGYAYQSQGRSVIYNIRIDSLENIVVAGFHQIDQDLNFGTGVNTVSGNGYFIAKYNPDAGYAWGNEIAPAGFVFFRPTDMTIDPQNNILVGGADYSADSFNIAAIKYNTNGTLVWNFKLNNYGGHDICDGIVTDHSGNFYISGAFTNTIDFDPGNGVTNKTTIGSTDAFFARYKDNSALPVTLIDFSGEANGKENLLQWTTASEQNNTGFEVQRSNDGSNFSPIDFINTKAVDGNSTSQLKYDYEDTYYNAGANYYRLKQIDKDGRYMYSNIVVLKDENAPAAGLSIIYPNPVKNMLNVKLQSAGDNKISLFVTDLNGRSLMNKETNISNGESIIQLDVSRLSSGTYFLKIFTASGGGYELKKFVKE